ncbi:DUF397 domain-containing protein [Streptomyces sp. RG80]|uniref:DUF397 domain-containing protein n=1 Tax=Streptomyces sp. RG80 TaxID=3157340 RepID=UPI00338D9A82
MSADPQSLSEPDWFKSSYSGGNTTECVEAAFIPSGVLVRDSKQPQREMLRVSAAAWANFVAATRGGH